MRDAYQEYKESLMLKPVLLQNTCSNHICQIFIDTSQVFIHSLYLGTTEGSTGINVLIFLFYVAVFSFFNSRLGLAQNVKTIYNPL